MKIVIVFFIAIVSLCATAQEKLDPIQIQTQLANTRPLYTEQLSEIADRANALNWINFKQGIPFQSKNDMQRIFNKLELSPNTQLQCFNTIVDKDLQTINYLYHQYYKGYKIVDAQLHIHTKLNELVKANGMIVRGELQTKTINISLQQALVIAKQAFNDSKGYVKDSITTVWARPNMYLPSRDNTQYTLCYSIEIKKLDKGEKYYIDCNTGEIIYTLPTVYSCVSSSNSTIWYGNKTIYSKYNSGPNNYQLINDCNPTNIVVLNRTDSNTYNLYSYSSTSLFSQSLATASYVAERSYTYFKLVHAREGQRGDSTTMVMLVDNPGTCPGCTGQNAYAGDTITFGNYLTTTTTDDYHTLDVVGHEMTHTVTYTNGSGGLDYVAESGALNESFSDIFGNLVEMYVEGYSDTSIVWQMGEDRFNSGGALWLRDTRDPNNKNTNNGQSGYDPKYYLGTYWKPTTGTCNSSNDACGVHSNSGVQNYFFYMLTTGSNGVSGVSFAGLGMSKARTIAYKTLTGGYLTSTSTYINARDAWVNAAVDLYGNCSIEAITVGKAWEAAGVGSYWYYGNNICGNYSGTQLFKSNSPYFISPSNCGVTILGTGNEVRFDGGHFVDITPGFNTNTGAFFTVKSNECYYSNY